MPSPHGGIPEGPRFWSMSECGRFRAGKALLQLHHRPIPPSPPLDVCKGRWREEAKEKKKKKQYVLGVTDARKRNTSTLSHPRLSLVSDGAGYVADNTHGYFSHLKDCRFTCAKDASVLEAFLNLLYF